MPEALKGIVAIELRGVKYDLPPLYLPAIEAHWDQIQRLQAPETPVAGMKLLAELLHAAMTQDGAYPELTLEAVQGGISFVNAVALTAAFMEVNGFVAVPLGPGTGPGDARTGPASTPGSSRRRTGRGTRSAG